MNKSLIYGILAFLVIPAVYADIAVSYLDMGGPNLFSLIIILLIETVILFYLLKGKLSFWYSLLTVFISNLVSFIVGELLKSLTMGSRFLTYYRDYNEGIFILVMLVLCIITIIVEWPVIYLMIRKKVKVNKYKVLYYSVIINIVSYVILYLGHLSR
ncbi:MAG: hypothetical protein AABX29_00085 [Nanoarchaeota archaeon]